jgi:hypothetical protein
MRAALLNQQSYSGGKRMKRIISLALISVFVLSFLFGAAAPQTEARPKLPCKVTCDYAVGMTLVCCKAGFGDNWDCFYTIPCGPGHE